MVGKGRIQDRAQKCGGGAALFRAVMAHFVEVSTRTVMDTDFLLFCSADQKKTCDTKLVT